MDPTTIFTGIDDFRGYTEGLLADTTYDQLSPSIRTVAGDIAAIITRPTLSGIAAFGEDATDAQKEGKMHLKTALANGAMARYQIFASTKKNGSDAALYKYQHEEIKEHYAEAFSRAMDDLLEWLDSNDVAGYQESDQYKMRASLPIKTAREFDGYYGIGNSSYFFAKIIFLLRNNWIYKVRPLLPISEEDLPAEIMELARRILAYRVMAQAVLQFDKTELPRSVHWDFNHEYTKGSEMQDREKLAAQMLSQVATWEDSLEVLIKSFGDGSADIEDNNAEDNKFYMM